jgi:hypothetical protein
MLVANSAPEISCAFKKAEFLLISNKSARRRAISKLGAASTLQSLREAW